MTYILIPIEGWKKRIEDLRKISGEASEEMQSFYSSAISELLLLKELCNGKEMSLDEKDIDLSYIEYCKKNPTLHIIYKDFTEGYKQALKDILIQ